MSFKEKSAWVMLIALSMTGLGYIYIVTKTPLSLAPPILPTIIAYTIALTLLAILGHIVIALWNPKEANAATDERDRLISIRASHFSSYILAIGVVIALGLYLIQYDASVMFYTIFGSLILSQITEYLLQITYYRRGII